MTRTRLRGLEIGGVQMGIELPESCPWRWPDAPIARFACLPRDPEVHVGVRVGSVPQGDLGGERYRISAWTFEVCRRGEDWLLGLERDGHREQLAHFDRDFRSGEVLVAASDGGPAFPLRTPLDEWIVLHRTVARGGLCLSATARAVEGHASLRLGAGVRGAPEGLGSSLASMVRGARSTILLREQAGRLYAYRTPWSDSVDPRLARVAPVSDVMLIEDAERPYRERLDPDEAADLLLSHAVVSVSDEVLLDRVLCNARRLAERVPVLRVGASISRASSLDVRTRSILQPSGPAPSSL